MSRARAGAGSPLRPPGLDTALEYREFLDHGRPVLFDVPKQPGSVVSALQLGKKLLVRRTDFPPAPAVLEVKLPDGTTLRVPKPDGKSVVLTRP